MEPDRRRILRWGGLAAFAGLAGCNAGGGTETEPSTDAETHTDAGPATGTDTPTAGTRPPGADALGGPNDRRAAATVDATILDADQGAGQYVNTPAVVWLEPGGTVTWNIRGGAHSVTAYHPDNDRPLRIPEAASSFDSGTRSAGETFEHTFETGGVYGYFCRPHEGLGMVGLVVVGEPDGGPGTAPPESEGIAAAARQQLSRLLAVAGIDDEGGGRAAYGWQAATWDSYWYSLYNMSTTISLSGVGVTFPATDEQRETFRNRMQAMLARADVDAPPVVDPNLNMAPFTGGDPAFTEPPVFDAGDGRPDASTLSWDRSAMSGVVSPSSLAWTHLKGVTWAKNFQEHFEALPASIAPKFRAQVLATLAQLGVKFALVD
ncbi:MAG: plastocyanin/azurin family copper-binding protein, partial [Halobacteriales archaeon]